jgi:hypothetical protein
MAWLEALWGIGFGLALGICGVFCLAEAARIFGQIAMIGDAPEMDVRSVLQGNASGIVKLAGVVKKGRFTATAPCSGTECIAHRTTVKYFSEWNSPRWRTVTKQVEKSDFMLTDGTGEIEVSAGKLGDSGVSPTAEETYDTPADREAVSERMRTLLTRDDGGPYETVQMTSRDLRVQERRLEPGDKTTVLGKVQQQYDGARFDCIQLGSVNRRGVWMLAAKGVFLGLFGVFLVSVVWFVSVPRFISLLPV